MKKESFEICLNCRFYKNNFCNHKNNSTSKNDSCLSFECDCKMMRRKIVEQITALREKLVLVNDRIV